MHVASHQDDDVGGGDRGKQFAVLCFFHVCAVELFHQSYGIRIDLPNFRPCGKAKFIISYNSIKSIYAEKSAFYTNVGSVLNSKLCSLRL